MFKYTKILLFLIVTTFLLSFSCNNEKSPVPYRHFEVHVNLSCPYFMNLGLGNNVFIDAEVCGVIDKRGSSGLGIIVYRLMPNIFVSFDRMCTSTTHEPVAVVLSTENPFYLVCPKCDSKYLISDGSIVSGTAKFYLMEFNTAYYPSNNLLVISN